MRVIFSQTKGPEYYNSNISFAGVYYKYVNELVRISEGDIKSLSFIPRTKVSDVAHPISSGTAAAQDLQDGLVDIAIGPYWVTGERLEMTAFTLPIIYDKFYLVVERRGANSLLVETKKVMSPFSAGLWFLILGVIITAALLSTWFTDDSERMENERNEAIPLRRKRRRYIRIAMDSLLEKGMFFCSAGVEQDRSSSFPNKVLLLGFGFFILIAVSAYVANLAAFLTRDSYHQVSTIEEAVDLGYIICAHPVVKTELESAWPAARFYYHQANERFDGVLNDYLAGKCKVMVVGYEDTYMDSDFVERLCNHNLVYTKSVAIEVPIAFSIRDDISSGFSYWIHEGSCHGVTLQNVKSEFQVSTCKVHIDESNAEASEYETITVDNMTLPIMFFVFSALIAVILQFKHRYNIKKGKKSSWGRTSRILTVHDVGRIQQRENELTPAQQNISQNDLQNSQETEKRNRETSTLRLTNASSHSLVTEAENMPTQVCFNLERTDTSSEAETRG